MDNNSQRECCVCFHSFCNMYPLGILREVLVLLVDRKSFYWKKLHSIDSWLCWECRSVLNKIYKFKKVISLRQEYIKDVKLLKLSKLPYLTVHTSQCEFDCFSEIMIEKYDNDGISGDECYTKKEIKLESFDCSVFSDENDDKKSPPLFVTENEVEISSYPQKINENIREDKSNIALTTQRNKSAALFPKIIKLKSSVPLTIENNEDTIAIPTTTHDSNEERIDLFPELYRYRKLKNRYDIIILREDEMQKDRMEKHENLKFDPFTCEKCFVICKTTKQIEEHHAKAHTRKLEIDFYCNICHTYVPNKERLIANHKRIHYVRYKCKQCSALFERANQASLHVYGHKERGCKKFRCKDCNNSYDEEKCDKHPDAKIVENLQCDHCKKYFKAKYALVIHMRSHSHVADVKCNVCSRSFKDPYYLKNHIKNIHEDQSVGRFYYCKDCKVEFKSEPSLRLHLKKSRKHMKSEAFHVCEYCNKKFCSKNSYANHEKLYHSNNPIICNLCGKKFISEDVLRRHKLAIHEKVVKNKERNHICDQCGKGFFERIRLRNHARIHSDLRPFACSLCSATFKFSAALYTHLKLVHKKKKEQK